MTPPVAAGVTKDASAQGRDAPWPRPGYSWYVVAVLVVVYVLSLVDRQILTLLVQPIRRDFGISDTEVSLLIGFAFALLYTVLGVPIATLADRRSRRTIIAIGVCAWSIMTMACGLARSFWVLFLARVGVGIGDATLQPSAYSLLADYFPPHKLGRAIGTYVTGLFLGAGLALVIGGAVIGSLSAAENVSLPLIGELRPWQLAFLAVGSPGILLGLLVMATVREPARRGMRQADPEGARLSTVLAFMRENRRVVTSIFTSFTLGGLAVVGFLAWVPEFLRRTYDMPIAEAGRVFGIEMAVLGTAGAYTGGWLCDWLSRRGYRDAALRLSALVFLALAPLLGLSTLAPDRDLALVLLGASVFTISLQQGLSPVALQLITPNEMRAKMVAIYFLIANLVAIGFGPTAIAIITDYGFGDDVALRYSMAIIGGSCCTAALAFVLWGMRSYRDAVEQAERWLGPSG
jgi:MFS family permease